MAKQILIASILGAALLFATGVQSNALRARDDVTANVELNTTTGQPQHLASGFIYGIPDNFPNQIPDHWYIKSTALLLDTSSEPLPGTATSTSTTAESAARSLVSLPAAGSGDWKISTEGSIQPCSTIR